MNTPLSESLNRYFAKRLLILSLFLSAVYGYGMSSLYTWGLDDTTLFYLENDGLAAVEALRANAPLPKGNDLRQFYSDWYELPEEVQRQFENPSLNPDAGRKGLSDKWVEFIESSSTDYFVLAQSVANESDAKVNWFYVVHSFDREQEKDLPGLAVSEVVLASGLASLLLFLLVAGLIHQGVSKAVEVLSNWAQGLEENASVGTATLPRESIHFRELQNVGEHLARAVSKNAALIERERTFLKCLSHELRTPMAIIGVAVDILETKQLPEDCVSKIEKIRHGNQRMKQTADTVLQLWQEHPVSESSEDCSVPRVLQEQLEEVTTAMPRSDIEFFCEVNSSLELRLPLESFRLILNNLIKNAVQYSAPGEVSITVTPSSLEISNPVVNSSDLSAKKISSGSDQQSYGFGLGLFIAEALAKQQGWKLDCSNEGDAFISKLYF